MTFQQSPCSIKDLATMPTA